MPEETETISLAEAARLAHVTRGTIQHWLRTGRLVIAEIPPRSESAKKRTPGDARPFGMRVRPADVLACSYTQRVRQMKRDNAELNLLTVREMSQVCSRSEHWVYEIVRKFDLTKYHVDNWTYLLSGEELWHKAQDDPYYSQLFLKL